MTTAHANARLSDAEIARGSTVLTATPRYVTIGSHGPCNASCAFCLGGDYPSFTLQRYVEFFEPRLADVMRHAEHLGFCGFGETLLLPDALPLLRHLNTTVPDTMKTLTTNGIPLTGPVIDLLRAGSYSLVISLHAAHAALHERLTGTRAFDRILDNIRSLTSPAAGRRRVHVNLSFVMTTLNIDDLPAFVELAHGLGADMVSCNHLTIYTPEHLSLSCFFQQRRLNAAVAAADERARSLGITFGRPLIFGPHPVPAPGQLRCRSPWQFFYVETQGSVNPCCSAGDHIGYLTDADFPTLWNGPGYLRLREGLLSGDIHTWCRFCQSYDPNNINDIRSHITFRPETQRSLLSYLKENAHVYPVAPETLEP